MPANGGFADAVAVVGSSGRRGGEDLGVEYLYDVAVVHGNYS